jgi:hypothetical protein
VTFVSGNPPEDSTLPMPWPYALPDGWSMEWDPSRPTQVPPSDVELGLSSISVPQRRVVSRFIFRCRYSNFEQSCINSY